MKISPEHIWNSKDKMSVKYVFLQSFSKHRCPLVCISLATARTQTRVTSEWEKSVLITSLAIKPKSSSAFIFAREHFLYLTSFNISDIVTLQIVFPMVLENLFHREKVFITRFHPNSMNIKSYEDIPIVAGKIIDNIWKQNKNIFEYMDRKEMVDQIFNFMIEELTDKIEDWKEP